MAIDPRKTARAQIAKTLADERHAKAMKAVGKDALEVPLDDECS